MNLPNLLTLCRFGMIPVYVTCFSYENYVYAFIAVILAIVTDILDGHLARSRGLVTKLGSVLDPLADKSMMLVVFLSLLYIDIISLEAAMAILVRDLGMIAGSALFYFRGKQTVPANVMGKLTTVLFYCAIAMLAAGIPYSLHFLWVVIGFSFLSSANYIIKVLSLNSPSIQAEKEHLHKGTP
ncbi:CDP-alcohol phosphatidyltransferase family protein [Paenibacillus gansuensis]|uniref:Phosphatidylglycerophosphate synthase n=1 Tax=Paenibacillus gansuensis TaxID=306542 RepID=A0ABW5PJD5_9BACL